MATVEPGIRLRVRPATPDPAGPRRLALADGVLALVSYDDRLRRVITRPASAALTSAFTAASTFPDQEPSFTD